MRKTITFFTVIFCVLQTRAQESSNDSSVFAPFRMLVNYSMGFQTHPFHGKPFKVFLKDTTAIKEKLILLQKYTGTDTLPISCLIINFPYFGVTNDVYIQWSQDQLKKFLNTTPKSVVGINKFSELHVVNYDSIYAYFFTRLGESLGKDFGPSFLAYRKNDALLQSMDERQHDFYGVGSPIMVNLKRDITSFCMQNKQIADALFPLIDMIDLQVQMAYCLELHKKYPKQKIFLPVASLYQLYVDWIARSLNTQIPMCILYTR